MIYIYISLICVAVDIDVDVDVDVAVDVDVFFAVDHSVCCSVVVWLCSIAKVRCPQNSRVTIPV